MAADLPDDEIGPTLADSRTLLAAMAPEPICVGCPAAQWYRIENDRGVEDLECFCTQFRGVMYEPRRNRKVTACDARADALEAARRR